LNTLLKTRAGTVENQRRSSAEEHGSNPPQRQIFFPVRADAFAWQRGAFEVKGGVVEARVPPSVGTLKIILVYPQIAPPS
jgi:hypothetical protein